MVRQLSTDTIYAWLEEVKDPEIPVLSLVDLGVITAVDLDGDRVRIEMTPTFVGCPALDYMKTDIVTVLKSHGVSDVSVDITFRTPWTSDRISEKGREALRNFGLAPPPDRAIFADLMVLTTAQCPRCGGSDTELKTLFGATLCRSLHYCRTCREAFEQFKPL
jgi:ring-1,2-phenylacetyl-CoA epoxidase subunit PaaD